MLRHKGDVLVLMILMIIFTVEMIFISSRLHLKNGRPSLPPLQHPLLEDTAMPSSDEHRGAGRCGTKQGAP